VKQTKAKYLASLAQYNRSLADNTASKYGESLARLYVAESLAKEASKLASTFSSQFTPATTLTSLAPDAPVSMVDLAKNHLALMTESLMKAQKDNDLVYNDVVPSEHSLPAIDIGKDVAEPIAIHDVYASPEVQKIVGPDLFARLVPMGVTESASMYDEEKAKLVRGEAEKADLADGELAAALEYMGLPGVLERYKSGVGSQSELVDPGAQVRAWSEEIRRGEEGGRVEDLMRKLEGLKGRAARQLEKSGRDLEVENRECEGLRVKYGHLWEQSPASGLTRSYRGDLRSHRESLEQASSSDAQVQGLWEAIGKDVDLLQSKEGLERTFVEVVGSGGASTRNLLDDDFGQDDQQEEVNKVKVKAITEGLSRLSKIKKERNDVLKDLKERVSTSPSPSLSIY
jgi:tyrosine-protein phosphatase non-receptor type 23